ncbi:MAG: M23 family metallopeptidase [Clostridia bacterium]|nr:M23 family metallopeptidase [Clostridia bacterium]
MNEKVKKSIPEFNLFVLQISAVAIIVVAAVVIKFCGGSFYTDVRNWYIENFEDETSVSEVIPSEQTESKPDELEILTEEPIESELEVTHTETEVVEVVHANASYDCNSLKMPVSGATLTSSYGNRSNPFTSEKELHKGMDFAAKKGTGIVSAAAGKVILVKNSASYGKYIKVDHGSGLVTLYAHCNSIIKKEGDIVRKGETIATVGSTGQSTGNHLHFEVILNGKNLNPEWLLSW